MWRRLTSAWTDLHRPLIAAAVTMAALAWIGLGGRSFEPVTFVTVVMAVLLASTMVDPFGGLVVGLTGSAVVFGQHLFLPVAHSHTNGAVTHAATVVLLLLLGATGGMLGAGRRRQCRHERRTAQLRSVTADGSLGLLPPAALSQRREDEMVRASFHDRPLAAAQVRINLLDHTLGADDLRRLERAVARTLEAEVRPTDVPGLDEDGCLTVLLPETTSATATDVLEAALMVVDTASFADRTHGCRRQVGEVAVLELSVVDLRAVDNLSEANAPLDRAPARTQAA